MQSRTSPVVFWIVDSRVVFTRYGIDFQSSRCFQALSWCILEGKNWSIFQNKKFHVLSPCIEYFVAIEFRMGFDHRWKQSSLTPLGLIPEIALRAGWLLGLLAR